MLQVCETILIFWESRMKHIRCVVGLSVKLYELCPFERGLAEVHWVPERSLEPLPTPGVDYGDHADWQPVTRE